MPRLPALLYSASKGQHNYAYLMVVFVAAMIFGIIFLAALQPKILGMSSVLGCGSPWMKAIGSMIQDATSVTLCG